jgi:hypothetical protein
MKLLLLIILLYNPLSWVNEVVSVQQVEYRFQSTGIVYKYMREHPLQAYNVDAVLYEINLDMDTIENVGVPDEWIYEI